MFIWIAFLSLALVAIFLGLLPLFRKMDVSDDAESFDAAVYKAQLAEVETDLERGIISQQDAEAARIEISRKLLAVSGAEKENKAPEERRGAGRLPDVNHLLDRILFFKNRPGLIKRPEVRLAMVGMPVLLMTLVLYGFLGEPGRPDLPLEARNQQSPQEKKIAELIAKVEERLRQTPNDKKGWEVLAPVLLREGQYNKAIHAFRETIRLNGENSKRLTGLGEAIVFQNNGLVPLEAQKAFRKALKIDPLLVMPRIRLAISKEQQGDFKGASAAYKKILDLSGQGAPWLPAIKKRLAVVTAKLSGEQGKKVAQNGQAAVRGSSAGASSRSSTPGAGRMSSVRPSAPGPTAEDIKNAQSMSAGDRSAMIEQMVARLAGKLEENGDNLNGWLRLMRAYKVLGKTDKASAAFKKAQTHFKEKPKELAVLMQAAKSMGIGS